MKINKDIVNKKVSQLRLSFHLYFVQNNNYKEYNELFNQKIKEIVNEYIINKTFDSINKFDENQFKNILEYLK